MLLIIYTIFECVQGYNCSRVCTELNFTMLFTSKVEKLFTNVVKIEMFLLLGITNIFYVQWVVIETLGCFPVLQI